MTTRPAPQLNSDDLEQLSAYLDRQLSNTERAALEARLQQEPALREALNELRATVAALRGLESLRPPRSFTITPASARQQAPWWSQLLRPAGGLIGALMVLIIAVGVIRSMSGGVGAPAQMSAAAPTAAPAAESPALRDAQTLRVAEPTAAPAAATSAPPQAAIVAESAAAPTATPAATNAPPDAAIAAAPAPEPTAAPAAEPPLAAEAATAAPAPTQPPGLPAGAADSADAALETPSAKIADDPGAAANPIATAPISSPATDTLERQPPLSPQPTAPVGLMFGVPFALTALLLVGVLVLWLRRRR